METNAPQSLHLNQLPAPPIQVQEKQPTSSEESPAPIPGTGSIDEQIISEKDFYQQYEHDIKIAADAFQDPETGSITVNPNPALSDGPAEALTDQEAIENTKILMDMRESAQAFGISYYVEGTVNSWENYLYPPSQKNNLIRAWSKIIAKHNIRVNPWLDVVQAELFATGPLVALAITARNERTDHERTKAKLKAALKENEQYKQQEESAEPTRRDTKKLWEIDPEGCFTHTPTAAYIKIDKRAEKPKLTKANYEMLVKYNGKEMVDRIFKITS